MKGWGVQSLSFWGAAPNREGLGGPILVHFGKPLQIVLGGSNPCPFGEPLQVVKGWGKSNPCPFGAPLQVVKGWGGGAILVLLGPGEKGENEIGRQPNVNGTFYKQNLVTENQLSACWKGIAAKS